MTDSSRIDLEADFPTDLDAELLDAEATAARGGSTAAPDAEAPPVVVIQYRNRGIPPFLMFPLALVVSLAMFAAYHYFVVRPKNLELQNAAIRAAAAARLPTKASGEEAEPKPGPGSLAGLPLPLTLESQPLPPGYKLPPPSIPDDSPAFVAAAPAEPAAKPAPQIGDRLNWNAEEGPEAVAIAEPAKPASPPPAVGFSRPSDQPPADLPLEPKPEPELEPEPEAVALAPKPDIVAEEPKAPEPVADDPPPPSRDEMLQAIQDEAVAKAAQREDLVRQKDEARARAEAEARQRVADERAAFRRALHDIVSVGGPDAGRQIDELCNQFGRNYGNELRQRVTAVLLRTRGKRLSRDDEIGLLRTLGVPEPGILDFLANGVKNSIGSRNGPRNPDEVRLWAARQLLRSRPTTTELDAARASSAIPRFPGR